MKNGWSTALLKDVSEFLDSEDLNRPLRTINEAFDNTSNLIVNLNKQVTPVAVEIVNLIHEFQKTLHAIRITAEYLSRHPEALLQGKAKQR